MINFNWRQDGWRLAVLIVLAFMYLSPGGSLLLEGRRDQVLSDGSDPATAPYQYGLVIDHAKNNPVNLFYGAVPTDRLNPPEGTSLWIPWTEKFSVVLAGTVFQLEQLTTAYLWIILVLTAFSFYLMGRSLGWERTIALALAICWAFNAYTRARSKVHMGLAGLYHLPLVILGVHLAVNAKSKRGLALAALAFLIAAGANHYYLVITAFLLPFIVGFIFLYSETRQAPAKTFGRVAIAAVPACLLVGFSFLKPIPSSFIKEGTTTYATTGETKEGETHPFMSRFGAHPIDYFTGDLAIGTADLNPIRGAMSKHILENLGDSNPHERTNGIRWLLWLAFGAALFIAGRQPQALPWTIESRRRVWLFAGLFLFCFLLSLPPDFFGPEFGPSLWLHKLVSQFRVPSRAGVFAQFAMLMVVGEFLQAWLYGKSEEKKKKDIPRPLWPKVRKPLLLGGILPFLAVIELPPFLNPMPIAKVVDVREDLADGRPCGYGMYFPYISGTWALYEYYYFLQSMRGSNCKIINAISETTSDRNRRFMQTMPLHEKLIANVQANPGAWVQRLVQFAQCVPLDWLVFDPRVGDSFRDQVCAALGWKQTSRDTCQSPERNRVVSKPPEACWQ